VGQAKASGRKRFFFEKKKQKTFGYWLRPLRVGSAWICKSFLVLFFKKEPLPSLKQHEPGKSRACRILDPLAPAA
jgi:hypothetical protein